MKLQEDRPSPETPCGSLSNLWVYTRLNDVESGSIRSKNSAISYGTAWTLAVSTPIMDPVQISTKKTFVGNTHFKVFFFSSLPILNLISAVLLCY